MSMEKEKQAVTHIEESTINDERSSGFKEDLGLPPPPELTPEQERKLYRKIDLRLMPILSLMYLLSFMDRGNIGNAKLQGLITQLHLTGNKYNVALTLFFIPYCLFEFPSNLVLKKFRPSRWLPFITIIWGFIMAMMGLVKNYAQLVGCRVCLGFAEAGLFPGVVYYLTLWYPRYATQYRIALFFGAATVAGAFSGILAYAIAFMSGVDGRLGWSWIFILEGCGTILVGILALIVLNGCDFPATAKFLKPEEKAYVMYKKKYDNSKVGEDEGFSTEYILRAFTDWQIPAHLLVYFSVVTPLYGNALFLPTIIHDFGYNTAISQLLTVPPYVFGTIVVITFSLLSDKYQMRSPFIIAGQLMCIIGYIINICHVPSGAKYFGMFLTVAGSYGAFPGVVAWLGNNLSPQYKRATGMALHIGIGNFSGAIASNIYRAKDSPRYLLGHAIELGFLGMGIVATLLIVLNYRRINAQRDAALQQGILDDFSKEELRKLGDRAPDFRYTL